MDTGNRMLPGGINTVLMRSFAKISSWEIDCVELCPAVTFTGETCIMVVFSVIAFNSRSCLSITLLEEISTQNGPPKMN